MIDYIEGVIVHSTFDFIILDKNGFGFKIFVPYKMEGYVKVFTKMFIKDEEPVLYGFKTREDRDLFEKLISVSGIGVKHAFSMIKNLSSEKIIQAIEDKDITTLSSVPGIGKKTAQRLIFELQGKIDFYENEIFEDVVSALVELGFDKKEAIKATKEALKKDKNYSVEAVLKNALKILSK